MPRRLLSRLARSRMSRGLAVALAFGFPLGAPLMGQTTTPDNISIISGLVCEGGSETFPVKITLPPAASSTRWTCSSSSMIPVASPGLPRP